MKKIDDELWALTQQKERQEDIIRLQIILARESVVRGQEPDHQLAARGS